MPKKKLTAEELTFEVEEIIGTLKESDKHDWAKSVLKISWADRPTTVDIRSFNFSNNRPGKGISLSEEETDSLVNLLLENEYGSMESLVSAINKKKSRYGDSKKAGISISGYNDDGYYVLQLKRAVL
jgi:hypothetical protein